MSCDMGELCGEITHLAGHSCRSPTKPQRRLVEDGVGFLGQFFGAVRPIDRTWCCERCREWSVRKGRETVVVQNWGGNRRLIESPQKP